MSTILLPKRVLVNAEKKFMVYINNTESIFSITKDKEINHYISVCSGFKSIYKCAIDWYPGKEFRFTYVDIIPTAVNFRRYFDKFCYDKKLSEIYSAYKKIHQETIGIFYNTCLQKIDNSIDEEIESLGLQYTWDAFIKEYRKAPKLYLTLDIINHVEILNEIISKFDDNKWFWYSNIFNWHQYVYSKEKKLNWIECIKDHNPNIKFCEGGL